MKTEIKKSGKGHNLFINSKQVGYVIGSKKNAEKEMKVELKRSLSNARALLNEVES
jgi:ribosomal protein S3